MSVAGINKKKAAGSELGGRPRLMRVMMMMMMMMMRWCNCRYLHTGTDCLTNQQRMPLVEVHVEFHFFSISMYDRYLAVAILLELIDVHSTQSDQCWLALSLHDSFCEACAVTPYKSNFISFLNDYKAVLLIQSCWSIQDGCSYGTSAILTYFVGTV